MPEFDLSEFFGTWTGPSPVYTQKAHDLQVITGHAAKAIADAAMNSPGTSEITFESPYMAEGSDYKIMKIGGVPFAAVKDWQGLIEEWTQDYTAKIVPQVPGKKFMGSSKFLSGDHFSHLSDPVGTVDTKCETCLAMWDAKVKMLHVKYLVALQAEGMDPVNIARAIGVWHQVVYQDL